MGAKEKVRELDRDRKKGKKNKEIAQQKLSDESANGATLRLRQH